MAKAFRAPLVALYVETTHTKDLSGENIEKLRKTVRLAEQLGAKIVSAYGDDIARQIAQYARLRGSTKIIIGRNQGSHKFGKKNVVDRLLELTPHIDVHVIPDSVRTVH